ncbi:MAG TPA: SH3 domain-containing protein [Usitatibacter sp.]|nr:SH3 domain-containing protein [Usitatibacter sp.]
MRIAVALLLLAFAAPALAQEQAFANRATELKDRGAADARTLASLAEGTSVRVLERAGGWTRVEAGGQQGWVRVFHLRFPAVAQAATSSGGGLGTVTSALGFGRETSKGSTVATTGVRGLSPEELKNAAPDHAAVARMHSYRADKATAERFAREGRLQEARIDAPEGSGR